jgi:hypothetical protein
MTIINIITGSRGYQMFDIDWDIEKLKKRRSTPTIILESNVLTIFKQPNCSLVPDI